MKAPVTGTIEKVGKIKEMPNKKFLQEFILIEPPATSAGNEKPYQIQNWADTRKELENMGLEERVGEKVSCTCYWNGYSYFSKTHGTSYGVRIALINIQNAE
jgi:hypothetical protein